MKLNIVTPCSRFENIKYMIDSIKSIKNMDVLWHICFDSDEIPTIDNIDIPNKLYCIKSTGYARFGNRQRNLILKNISDGFIFFLDDDNIIHPNLNNILNSVEYENNYLFSQVYKQGKVRFKPNTGCLYPGKIDSAQMLVSASSLNVRDIIWPENVYLAEYCFAYNINKISTFKFIDDVGAYYNYLSSGI